MTVILFYWQVCSIATRSVILNFDHKQDYTTGTGKRVSSGIFFILCRTSSCNKASNIASSDQVLKILTHRHMQKYSVQV
jgi:hypothetical protein